MLKNECFVIAIRVEVSDESYSVFPRGIYDFYPLKNSQPERLSKFFTLNEIFNEGARRFYPKVSKRDLRDEEIALLDQHWEELTS